MAKEKSAINPAQAQRKLEKQKALKKGKAEVLARRTAKLAHRNPEQLQRQIDVLKDSGRALAAHERTRLADLERDLRIVTQAREKAGTAAPPPRARADNQGKRPREQRHRSFTPPDVRAIPMPRDTPPPVPARAAPSGEGEGKGANAIPLGANARGGGGHALPSKPEVVVAAAKTVYEAAPVLRDLRKEAVSKFVPAAVARKLDAVRGRGGKLLEAEEMAALEREGYLGKGKKGAEGGEGDELEMLDREQARFGEAARRGVVLQSVADDEEGK